MKITGGWRRRPFRLWCRASAVDLPENIRSVDVLPGMVPPGEECDAEFDAFPRPRRYGSGIGLVFADGAAVELSPSDPRVMVFRATAEAVLGATGDSLECRTGE